MRRTYRIAEKNIEICSLYDEVHNLCADYQTDGTPDFSVMTAARDIEYERSKAERENLAEGRGIVRYPDSYLETLAVYRKIAGRMTEFNTLLFHGSVIAVDGEAYLFTAKSGTGKSTHTRLWREVFGERAVMINDDKPLLKVTGSGVTAFGTPWNGKHRLGENTSAPLKAICVLERGERNRIRELPVSAALPFLIQQMYRPADAADLTRSLALLDMLANQLPLYRLQCNISHDAVYTAYNGMNKTYNL